MTTQPEMNDNVSVEPKILSDKTKSILKIVGIGAAVGTLAYLINGQTAMRQVITGQQDTIDHILDRIEPADEEQEVTD